MTKKILLLILISALSIVQMQAQTHTKELNNKKWSYTISGDQVTINGATNTDGSKASGELNIPSTIGTGRVTAIKANAFQNNANITKLTANSVTTIGNFAFENCSGLTGELNLPNATTIGRNAFKYCSKLTALKLPNATTINNQAFWGCEGITGKLSLPKVTTIGSSAFNTCKNITELDMPNIASIGGSTFSTCTGLIGKLELPSTLKILAVSSFQGCSSLTAVKFASGTVLTSITGADGRFEGCDNLQYIDMTGVKFPSNFTTVSRSSSLFNKLQPYVMVYLPASAPAPQSGQENFVRGNRCEKFVVYDSHEKYQAGKKGCEYPIQYDFKATTAEYKNRSFSGATCKTICLPYPFTIPAGMTAYAIEKKNTVGRESFMFTSISGNRLAANTPYLLRITNGATHTFAAESNVDVAVTPTAMETQPADGIGFYFGGTATNIDNATAAGRNLYNLSSNVWHPIKTSNTDGYVHSFRAYIRATGGAPAKSFAIVLSSGQTTDIDNAAELTEDDLRSGRHIFYTIDGRRAGTDYDKLKSGEMYVVKGQKFYKF